MSLVAIAIVLIVIAFLLNRQNKILSSKRFNNQTRNCGCGGCTCHTRDKQPVVHNHYHSEPVSKEPTETRTLLKD